MVNVDNKYISDAIKKLMGSVGVKENIEHNSLLDLVKQGEIKKCIILIADYFGLSVSINMHYVSDSYNPYNQGEMQFISQDLVKFDEKKGSSGIVAQVSIPGDLPMFGSFRFRNFPLDVKISNNTRKHPKVFIAIMAHEFSHILLHSITHPEKNNEVYTDLTAMLLGFNETMKQGRKVKEEIWGANPMSTAIRITRYGYLKDKQFYFAYHKIKKNIKRNIKIKNGLKEDIDNLSGKINTLEQDIQKFRLYINCLDKNLDKKIKTKSSKEIVLYHSSNYLDELKHFIKKTKPLIASHENFLKHLRFYKRDDWALKIQKEIQDLKIEFQKQNKFINTALKVLSKNITMFEKFLLFCKNKILCR